MKIKKRAILVPAVAGLLALGLVGAQEAATPESPTEPSQTPSVQEQPLEERLGCGFGGLRGGGFGLAGLPVRGLAAGTTVEVTFYALDTANLQAGLSELSTHNLVVGEDSEAAFMETLAEASADAAYMEVSIGEQTHTINLENSNTLMPGGFGLPGMFFGRGLSEGSSVDVTFYDGDPEAGGAEQRSLSFTYGEDSEVGFANELEEAMADAAYAVVTLSPQTYTVQVSGDGNLQGRPGPGGGGRNFGPGRLR